MTTPGPDLPAAPGGAVRTALFVDFDNVFFSLRNVDAAAAKTFANEPRRWLEAIAEGGLVESEDGYAPARRILLRRCYANPSVMRFFRGAFTRAGFQIIDCPSLTGQGKNSADIAMVIDALELIGHPTRFDEFIILSGDADFTPLLTRLRMHDRRTAIYANPVTASAYWAVCDGMISEERLMERLGTEPRGERRDGPAGGERRDVAARRGEPNGRRGDEPVPVRRVDDPVSPRVSEEPAPPARRGDEPAVSRGSEEEDGGGASVPTEVAALARRVADATGTPLLPPETYAALFRALAAEVDEHGYAFNRTVQGVAVRLAQQGHKVRAGAVAFVLKGLVLSGHPIIRDGTAAGYAKAFRHQVHYLAAGRELELGPAERLLVGAWIVGGLKGVPEDEIAERDQPSDAEIAAEVAGEDGADGEDRAAAAEADADAEARDRPPGSGQGGGAGAGPDIAGLLARIRGT